MGLVAIVPFTFTAPTSGFMRRLQGTDLSAVDLVEAGSESEWIATDFIYSAFFFIFFKRFPSTIRH